MTHFVSKISVPYLCSFKRPLRTRRGRSFSNENRSRANLISFLFKYFIMKQNRQQNGSKLERLIEMK